MKIAVDIPEVGNCSARQCAFNCEGNCHAQAITIGDAIEPICDTFLASTPHSCSHPHAGVGACKVSGCRHNRNLACGAEAVRVIQRDDRAECATYAAR